MESWGDVLEFSNGKSSLFGKLDHDFNLFDLFLCSFIYFKRSESCASGELFLVAIQTHIQTFLGIKGP